MAVKQENGNVTTSVSITKSDYGLLKQLRKKLGHTTTSETMRFLIRLGAAQKLEEPDGAH